MEHPTDLAATYLASTRATFAKYRQMAEAAFRQVSDAQFFAAPDAESNSIAVIVKHVAGNMRSRWTDFLTTDGEKPDRDRDGEFEPQGDRRAALMEAWNAAWDVALRELHALTASDLTRTVTIRAEPHSVVQAIDRQATHLAYHVGQVVYLAKHYAGDAWQTLSIPRNRSREFTDATVASAASSEPAR